MGVFQLQLVYVHNGCISNDPFQMIESTCHTWEWAQSTTTQLAITWITTSHCVATKGKRTGKEQQIEPDLDKKAVHTDGD